jgi:hypothetical protein
VVERLTTAAGRATGATCTTTGTGLTTPVKPMLPKVWGSSGAWAAEGAATATGDDGTLLVVAAEAGSAREATMAPVMTIAAEAWLAGLTERDTAEEMDSEIKGLGER